MPLSVLTTPRRAALLTVLVILQTFSSSTFASDGGAEVEDRRYSKYYSGAFVEVGSRAGLQHASGAALRGWSWDVGLRQAFPMHLLDTRLAYGEERFSRRDGDAGGDFVARAVDLTTAFHPLYLALLLSNWGGYVLASFYVEAGIGGQHVTFDAGELRDFGLRLHLGTGIDAPITDPDRGVSLWLSIAYRFTWADFDVTNDEEVDLRRHAGFAGLALRFNGLLF